MVRSSSSVARNSSTRIIRILDALDIAGGFEIGDQRAHRLLRDARCAGCTPAKPADAIQRVSCSVMTCAVSRRSDGRWGPRESVAFHALISVKADRATIERIGARLFELYELWVENRVMLELVTEDMLPAYVRIANGDAQRAPLARQLE